MSDAPTISDEWIAERWPEADADEIRRRFNALMDKIGESPWRGVPRFPEVMQPVLAWAAMLPSERIEVLTTALADVPEHFRDYLYVASKPAFGEQSVKYMQVAGDNGHGMGKQAIAIAPYVKGYNIAPWIAAASPGNVGALLAELERLRAESNSVAAQATTDQSKLAAALEQRAKAAYDAYKDAEKPLNRYPWESLTENSKAPFRAIAGALTSQPPASDDLAIGKIVSGYFTHQRQGDEQ